MQKCITLPGESNLQTSKDKAKKALFKALLMHSKIWNTNFTFLGTWALSELAEIKNPIPQLPWLQQFLFFFQILILSSDSLKKVFPALQGDSLSTWTRALSGVGSLWSRPASGDMFSRKNCRVTPFIRHQTWLCHWQPAQLRHRIAKKQTNQFSCITDINIPDVSSGRSTHKALQLDAAVIHCH